QQCADIRNVRRAGEHQGQRPGDFGDGSKASFTDGLQGEPILDEMRVRDHADHRSRHCSALVIPSRYTSTRRPPQACKSRIASPSSNAARGCGVAPSTVTYCGSLLDRHQSRHRHRWQRPENDRYEHQQRAWTTELTLVAALQSADEFAGTADEDPVLSTINPTT